MNKPKLTGWQKFKNGLGKVWKFASDPLKKILNIIPGVGPTLSKVVGIGERIIPAVSNNIEQMVSRRRK